MTYGEKSLYTRFFTDFLLAQDPDVVHLQHTLFVGCELVSLIRRLLPSTPIVYTLHDYMPICNRDGTLVRTDESLCLEATPRRCHECFSGSRSKRSSSGTGSSGHTWTRSNCFSRRASFCSSGTRTGASRGRRSGSRNAGALRRYPRRRAAAIVLGTGWVSLPT